MTRRWRRGSGLAVGLAIVSLSMAGCVNLPTGGAGQGVKSLPNSDQEGQLVITPRAPSPNWQPRDIVSGFLVAIGADPSDLSIARDYLTGTYAKAWHPRSSPQVIDTHYQVNATIVSPPHVAEQLAQVTVTSRHLESLVAAGRDEAGRLQVTPGPAPYVFTFELIQRGGRWRIESILKPDGKASDSILLLSDADFERDYLPRNLYYLARGTQHTLVPYPVYIPAQPGELGGVQQLIDAVRTLPPTGSNWLYHAINTAFPPHTVLTAQIVGTHVVVDLGGPAARAPAAKLKAMEAQLVWTLTYAPDSPGGTGVTSVALQVGRKLVPDLLSPQFTSWLPQGSSGPLYYQTLDEAGLPHMVDFSPGGNFASSATPQSGGAANSHDLAGGRRRPALLATGLGRGPFSTVAVSPALNGVNYFAACRGTKAYVAPMVFQPEVESRDLPGNCTSLSWDSQGDCWAVAGSDVWVLNATPTGLHVIPVSIPAQQIAVSDDFVALAVAPDGLRVAMIVRNKNRSSVYVSAITKKQNSSTVYLAQGGPVLTAGPDLVDPVAVTWWDSSHLLVLERVDNVSQIYEVPLNGGESTRVLTPRDATSVSANGSYVAVEAPGPAGQDQPTAWASHGLEGPWVPVDAGRSPSFES